MHPNALLELATELIHQVLQLKHPADGVVSDFFRQHRALGSRERHTLAETTYGVLRQRLLYQHLAQSGKGEMERRLAVLAWQGNEGFLRAALSETEQQWLAQVGQVDRTALPDKLRHNLPEWLAERLQARGTRFVIEPYVRFQGQVGEQATMFLLDPCGNALEFKAFKDMSQLFAK